MQHNVLPVLLDAFRGVQPRAPEAGFGDVRVVPLVPLNEYSSADRSPTSSIAATALLDWRELVRPEPRSVHVHNPTPSRAIVEAGTILAGGMSARAVVRTVVVAPGEAACVGVEPLAARWWDEGQLHRNGRLGAVAAGLLLQAAHAGAPSAWSARAALWSLRDDELRQGSPDPGGAIRTTGWALLLRGDVVAAWLPCRVRTDSRKDESGWSVVVALDATPLIDSVSRGMDRGDLAVEVARSGDVEDLVVVPRDLRLADQVAGLASA